MARGKATVITTPNKGVWDEGVVATGQTLYPGMIVQRDVSLSQIGGRWQYTVYNRAADGDHPAGAFWVVTHNVNSLQGKAETESYAAGDRLSVYSPAAGEELNLLIANLAGTADDHTKGEILMVDDGTGKLIATTGTPETECAILLETITDPTADTLAWCEWTGH